MKKMKYSIQFAILPYLRDLLKDDLKNIPYSFKFDETTTLVVDQRIFFIYFLYFDTYFNSFSQCLTVFNSF